MDDSLNDLIIEEADGELTLRSLVSTKEAGIIIGKAGKNVAELRDATGVKAGVSKVVQGFHDRVLTVTGSLQGVAKAYSLIAQTLLNNPLTTGPVISYMRKSATPLTTATIRLLISHNLMGTVIGRQGAKIKHIQDDTGVRMVASKTLLPQSTERVVELRGTVDAIEKALLDIGQCLMEDKERAYGTILYNPSKVLMTSQSSTALPAPTSARRPMSNGGGFNQRPPRSTFPRTGHGTDFQLTDNAANGINGGSICTQQVSIPSDMVGCIIGKRGTKISEIRQLSGSRISIAKVPHDDTGERMFTIQGTPESNERALFLLYEQLDQEKKRRELENGQPGLAPVSSSPA
ncbi:hypothetical protein DM01DRAFT_1340341 [Hesseltinella vesiculosa]|uniref:K Homology domain-containing protein n=1 Tax=Hesseltinella vesiculosa TaxID=101127 RepID=A0A1X2G4A9_9FUNG|nr:hypothetical protein DM01DRAFT_1340341 [Hesseltinella vesiculosa]